MSVYLRGETWWCKFQFDGQAIRRSTGTAKKREALRFERNLKTEFEKGRKKSNEPTFGEALLRWIQEDAPKSMISHIRNTRPHLEQVPLSEVIEQSNLMKIDMLNAGLSVQTINRRLAVVRRVMNLAFTRWNLIDQPLGMKVELFSEKGCSREIYLEREEVETLVSNVDNDIARAIILIAAFTGLRRSELLRLEQSNWKLPYIILTSKTKSKKPRSVPLVEDLHALMDLVPFQITENQLRRSFEKARDKLERPEVRFHDLRHTFASWLAKDPSVPLLMIKELLGHSTLAVTSKYAHLRGGNAGLIQDVLGTTTRHIKKETVLH